MKRITDGMAEAKNFGIKGAKKLFSKVKGSVYGKGYKRAC
jgi:hypothetical protein